LLGRRFKYVFTATPDVFAPVDHDKKNQQVSAALAIFMAMLPVAIILFSMLAAALVPEQFKPLANFIADPLISFSMSVCIMLLVLIKRYNYTIKHLMDYAVQATAAIAVIIMIIAAGGAFKQVLIDSGVGDQVKLLAQQIQLSPLFFGWLVAAMIRVTLGSATVAGLTAAGIVAPLVAAGNVSPELMVLAVGSGSLMFSHVNDTGFWMFKEYFNLSIKQTFLSWTLMETIVSILGLIGVLIINFFL
jgi:H+/gluconate symporter-like permease